MYLYDGLLYLVTKPNVTILNSKVATKAEATILVWYLRLGHIHPRKLVSIAKEGTIKITGSRELHCVACIIVYAH